MVVCNNKNYYIDIVETKPSLAISIIETDCELILHLHLTIGASACQAC